MSALPPSRLVAVIGAGVMGSGIAMVAAAAGHPVRLYDLQPEAAANAVAGIRRQFAKLAARGKLSEQQAEAAANLVSPADALDALCEAGLVIEAIVERLDAKQALFRQLEAVVADDCLFASNTSSISITAIAAALQQPARLAGMHFFNPAPQMALVEIVSGLASAPHTLQALTATAQAWGKTTVAARSAPGFIVNRIARPFYSESLRLAQDGIADHATLDALLREAGGFRMGPFELMDLIGLDINFAVSQSVWQATFHDPRYTPTLTQQEMVNAGWLGRKSGRGFYHYGDGVSPPVAQSEPPQPCPLHITVFDDSVAGQALAARLAQAGVNFSRSHAGDGCIASVAGARLYPSDGHCASRRALESGQPELILLDLALDYARATRLAIQASAGTSPAARDAAIGLLQAAGLQVTLLPDAAGLPVLRTVAMLVNEATDLLGQGHASAHDIDTAMRLGVNYPCGPLAWGEQIGFSTVRTVIRHLADSHGEDRYRVAPLLERLHFAELCGQPAAALYHQRGTA
ncbi:3-hydroxyacyl-CoA dehydrogenase [Vogesella sp. LIG4]|uniref:3-hydroxyacyl-CoA dehydrogenase n=1 Tax=Vogesella sp. LIG4 TaxID=1192162 RepID=UPI00081F7C12|nr:3-hydroxyacyl-CoA dehydrogenase [Vogesella sp. LIG4]SCK28804.1 3-hydroxyacyl-CoA dehydrogenase [Vogesella sp. LIG4]